MKTAGKRISLPAPQQRTAQPRTVKDLLAGAEVVDARLLLALGAERHAAKDDVDVGAAHGVYCDFDVVCGQEGGAWQPMAPWGRWGVAALHGLHLYAPALTARARLRECRIQGAAVGSPRNS